MKLLGLEQGDLVFLSIQRASFYTTLPGPKYLYSVSQRFTIDVQAENPVPLKPLIIYYLRTRERNG